MAGERKKGKKVIGEGNVYISATFNNTIVTVTDLNGNSIAWASAGQLGFKGAKKSTPYAAQVTATTAVNKAIGRGMRLAHIYVKGPGIGRDLAIRSIGALNIQVRSIKDVTPIPHNGCRPRKKKRN